MKKQITITLEVDSDDEYCMMDAFIKDDLATEIGCCSNFYEIKDICIGASAERTDWIPVSERPPEIGEDVFFCDIDGDIYRGHRANHRWWSEVEDVKDVVAWMPLPKPYEEG